MPERDPEAAELMERAVRKVAFLKYRHQLRESFGWRAIPTESRHDPDWWAEHYPPENDERRTLVVSPETAGWLLDGARAYNTIRVRGVEMLVERVPSTKTVWHPPEDPFVEYGPEDMGWLFRLGFGERVVREQVVWEVERRLWYKLTQLRPEATRRTALESLGTADATDSGELDRSLAVAPGRVNRAEGLAGSIVADEFWPADRG